MGGLCTKPPNPPPLAEPGPVLRIGAQDHTDAGEAARHLQFPLQRHPQEYFDDVYWRCCGSENKASVYCCTEEHPSFLAKRFR